MKRNLILILAAVAIALSAQAQVESTNWTSGFVNDGVVPDNDPSGLAISEEVTAWSGMVSNVTVTVNLTGGWNGDVYAYLYHDGEMTVLLNQVGTSTNNVLGYGDNGVSVTFSDAALNSIHNYQNYSPSLIAAVLQGTWKPDGEGLSVFNGAAAAGTWSLYLADKSAGGVMTLNSWGLQMQVTAVAPEPSTLTLLAFGGLMLLRRRK